MKMKKPIVIVNYKTYIEGTGYLAFKLSKSLEEIKKMTNIEIIVAPQYVDIPIIASHTNLEVFAQHFDPIQPGRNTGFVSIDSLISRGATGSLLNHSEHRLRIDTLEEGIKLAKKKHFKTVVCCNDPLMALAVASFEPDYIAYEPPELIAGNVSVSEAKPEAITKIVRYLKKKYSFKILVGAGIKKNEDVKIAMKLGCDGILISSGIVKAKNPGLEMLKLLRGFY